MGPLPRVPPVLQLRATPCPLELCITPSYRNGPSLIRACRGVLLLPFDITHPNSRTDESRHWARRAGASPDLADVGVPPCPPPSHVAQPGCMWVCAVSVPPLRRLARLASCTPRPLGGAPDRRPPANLVYWQRASADAVDLIFSGLDISGPPFFCFVLEREAVAWRGESGRGGDAVESHPAFDLLGQNSPSKRQRGKKKAMTSSFGWHLDRFPQSSCIACIVLLRRETLQRENCLTAEDYSDWTAASPLACLSFGACRVQDCRLHLLACARRQVQSGPDQVGAGLNRAAIERSVTPLQPQACHIGRPQASHSASMIKATKRPTTRKTAPKRPSSALPPPQGVANQRYCTRLSPRVATNASARPHLPLLVCLRHTRLA